MSYLITEYLSSRKELFPDEAFKPKHHFLLHCPELFSTSGPIVNNWCMRFEAKHRELIAYAKNIKNKINMPVSLAMKYALKQSDFYLNNDTLQEKIKYGPKKLRAVSNLKYYESFFKILPEMLLNEKMLELVEWVEINNVRFRKGYFLIHNDLDILPDFGEIIHIIHYNKNCLFICNLYKTIGFNEHVHAYSIQPSCDWKIFEKKEACMKKPMKMY